MIRIKKDGKKDWLTTLAVLVLTGVLLLSSISLAAEDVLQADDFSLCLTRVIASPDEFELRLQAVFQSEEVADRYNFFCSNPNISRDQEVFLHLKTESGTDFLTDEIRLGFEVFADRAIKQPNGKWIKDIVIRCVGLNVKGMGAIYLSASVIDLESGSSVELEDGRELRIALK